MTVADFGNIEVIPFDHRSQREAAMTTDVYRRRSAFHATTCRVRQCLRHHFHADRQAAGIRRLAGEADASRGSGGMTSAVSSVMSER